MSDHQVRPPLLFVSSKIHTTPQVQAQSQYYSNHKKDKDEKKQQEESNETGRKKFQQMSLDDRFRYISELPSIMPKMKCEVVTEEQAYTGIVDLIDERMLVLKIIENGMKIKIKRDSIMDIKLVGF
ncbi:CotO family spore coat protein [Halalkalibacillus halophilus]|uniref:CotO family spore coat protein n=1 Tax=Halalkalibacillus halophilus TaxID=392827 RepID=UPI0003F7241E|nr:CotO family spore coat protein [Halalkalibacillus halophilus]